MRMLTTISLSLVVAAVSATAWAKPVHSADHHSAPSGKAKHAGAATGDRDRHAKHRAPSHDQSSTMAAQADRQRRDGAERNAAQLPPLDQYIGPMRVVGPREIGKAAWYGGRHIGGRTASGERLDAVHATAAHRSLPLHSLVRVTNLSNGRSVIATINDRGPVSRSLVIDLSPRVADELDMRRAGVAKVAVEPVAQAATTRR